MQSLLKDHKHNFQDIAFLACNVVSGPATRKARVALFDVVHATNKQILDKHMQYTETEVIETYAL